MELKQYQSQVLQDLKSYLGYLNQYHNNAKAYTLLWESKGVKVGSKEKMKPYKNVLPRVPHVCFKVPTGGGKTFLACASVKPIFDALTMSNVKAVVWLVPSDAILSQTVRNLKNTESTERAGVQSFCREGPAQRVRVQLRFFPYREEGRTEGVPAERSVEQF